MANWYVWSGATGTASGADWANAKLTIAAAITASANGDYIWVAHDHAETSATAITMTLKGTRASPCRIICVDRAGTVPPVAADLRETASVTLTTIQANIAIENNNGPYCWIHGIIFQTATGDILVASRFASGSIYFNKCQFNVTHASQTRVITLGGNSGPWTIITLNDCTVRFGFNQDYIVTGAQVTFQNTSSSQFVASAVKPTVGAGLVSGSNSQTKKYFRNMDLSGLGNCSLYNPTMNFCSFIFEGCKLDDATYMPDGTSDQGKVFGDMIACTSASTGVIRNERCSPAGKITTENTIVRTGGFTDNTNQSSWKMAGAANLVRLNPLTTFEGSIFSDTLTAQTLTVHMVTDNVTLTDADLFMELWYPDGSKRYVLISTERATPLTTPANLATSTETWVTTGLTTPVKQKVSATFTQGVKGYIKWRIHLVKASTTVYVCPQGELS